MADLKTKMEEQIKLFEEWPLQKKLQDKNERDKNDAHQIKEKQKEEKEPKHKMKRIRHKLKPTIGLGGEKKERGKQMGKAEKLRGELDDAEKEILELEQLFRCKVCLDKDSCIVFFPCRHMATCEYCEGFLHSCPICRLVIEEAVKLSEE